jgi:hypothetical protein
MARRGGGAILSGMSRSVDGPALPAPIAEFRRGSLSDDFAARIDEAADEDASAPLQREALEIDTASIFPGVPFH